MLATARASIARPLAFIEILARLPAKDRVDAEKRVAALEAAARGRRGRVGRQSVQSYVADGKYRMQVFEPEDLRDSHAAVCSAQNVLADTSRSTGGPFARCHYRIF